MANTKISQITTDNALSGTEKLTGVDGLTNINITIDQIRAYILPAGGTTGQILAKASDDNYDAEWIDAPQGGGGEEGNDLIIASSGDNLILASSGDNLIIA